MNVETSSSSLTLGAQNDAPTQRTGRTIRPPSFSPFGLLGNIKLLSQHTDLIYTLSVHRIKIRYKQSVLGIAWAMVHPLSLMLIYTFIFSTMAKFPSNGVPYPVFVYSALLPWTSFSAALTNGTTSLVTNSSLITKVYFPREILPLTNIIAAVFDFLIASTILLGLMAYYHVPLTLMTLWALPIFLIQMLFATTVILFLSATNVIFRDIGLALPLVMQLWIFATPVAYPLSAVPAGLRPFYVLNPMVGIIDSFRRVIIQGSAPDFHLLSVSIIITCLLLPISYIYFKHVEATAVDVI